MSLSAVALKDKNFLTKDLINGCQCHSSCFLFFALIFSMYFFDSKKNDGNRTYLIIQSIHHSTMYSHVTDMLTSILKASFILLVLVVVAVLQIDGFLYVMK